MTCQEYLEQHSDLLDEQLAELEAVRCRNHAAQCPSCARYDRVVRGGLRLVREMPDPAPAYDFHARLQHRIFHVQDDMDRPERFTAPGASVALMIAGLIAFAAWAPLMAGRNTAPGGADSGSERAATFASEPVRSDAVGAPDWWYGGSSSAVFTYAAAGQPAMGFTTNLATAFAGPYSPLIVSPPYAGANGARVTVRYNE